MPRVRVIPPCRQRVRQPPKKRSPKRREMTKQRMKAASPRANTALAGARTATRAGSSSSARAPGAGTCKASRLALGDEMAICAAYRSGYCTTVLGGGGTYSYDCCAGVERTPTAVNGVVPIPPYPTFTFIFTFTYDADLAGAPPLPAVLDIGNELEVLAEVDEDEGPAYETGRGRVLISPLPLLLPPPLSLTPLESDIAPDRSNGIPIPPPGLRNAMERCTSECACECECGPALHGYPLMLRYPGGPPPEEDELTDEYDVDEVVDA
ncbi:hypothetical protein B0H16DRAFT_1892275 [Mycena metata]|uniref:Uncharacterized protein n=1 Tax=Mycena metata TaxID=1033252 RepID=A0AAD7I541_9AGAR|nr:hypothetical protein B0H16DRAFT_1892275 [Mycena metata]